MQSYSRLSRSVNRPWNRKVHKNNCLCVLLCVAGIRIVAAACWLSIHLSVSVVWKCPLTFCLEGLNRVCLQRTRQRRKDMNFVFTSDPGVNCLYDFKDGERCLTESFQRKLREGGAFWYFIYLQPFQTLYRGHFICSAFSKKSCGYLRQMTLCVDTLIHSFIQMAICCRGAIVSCGWCVFFVSFEPPVWMRKTQLRNHLDKPY